MEGMLAIRNLSKYDLDNIADNIVALKNLCWPDIDFATTTDYQRAIRTGRHMDLISEEEFQKYKLFMEIFY